MKKWQVENSKISEISKISEKLFRVFLFPSFRFCPTAKIRNSDLKISEKNFRDFPDFRGFRVFDLGLCFQHNRRSYVIKIHVILEKLFWIAIFAKCRKQFYIHLQVTNNLQQVTINDWKATCNLRVSFRRLFFLSEIINWNFPSLAFRDVAQNIILNISHILCFRLL